MDKMDIAKGLIFKEFNITSNESLDDRIIIQKKVYLLQEEGIDLGYGYNWYLKGPYSPTLTKYVYDNLNLLKNKDYNDFSLNAEVRNKVERINDFYKDKPNRLSESSWYELLASILYIYRNHHIWIETDSKEDVISVIQKEKPKYSREECNFGFDKLVEYNYLKV